MMSQLDGKVQPDINHTTAPYSVKLQRPIRFVTDNEEPQTKRRRISAACRTCQRRKTKCSGEKPTCKTCVDSDNDCLGYAEPSTNGSKSSNQAQPRSLHTKGSSSLGPNVGPQDNSHSPRVNETAQGSTCEGSLRPLKIIETSFVSEASSKSHNDKIDEPTSSTVPVPEKHPKHENCVPFFRYFGPTAIVPGFKQMVVELNQPDGPTSTDHSFMGGDLNSVPGASPDLSRHSTTPDLPGIPVYNKNDQGPVDALIISLCETFFENLGCNYPFLTRSSFFADLRERKADPILVDAICAIAARFSRDPALALASRSPEDSTTYFGRVHKSRYGHVFARRAMSSITRIFACPNLAAVQACLLLAYEQFGSDRDSGLWIYLGLSIRMAQDLGLQKLEGLQYEGYLGPTPKTAKSGAAGKLEEQRREERFNEMRATLDADDELRQEKRRAEQERINTFWAIFFLDRVVSSGTGRPVSLRDKDIEISFPSEVEPSAPNHWPAPFPALIRIIHLYGRVANLLNNIREANQVNQATLKQLIAAEDDLIGIYQRLSPKLHFSAANFQHYLKRAQATNFVLLHFWFHTLIVLLHQPTLLHSFEGRIQQLFPNSLELSLSSAKTIADMLSFAELLDSKSYIGNPFTSQPMYIAACAFLLESATHSVSRSQSREATPPGSPRYSAKESARMQGPSDSRILSGIEPNRAQAFTKKPRPNNKQDLGKQSLLAAAATHNYQRCYNALKALESYWAGTRYIVTVLDQKAKGSLDPLLYSAEDLGNDPQAEGPQTLCEFPSRSQRRPSGIDTSLATAAGHRAHLSRFKSAPSPVRDGRHSSGNVGPNQAIGWSLTGSTDSADSNLSLLYQPSRAAVSPLPPTQGMQGPLRSGFDTSMPTIQEIPGIPGDISNPQVSHQILPAEMNSGNTAQLQGSYSTIPCSINPIAQDSAHIRSSTLPDSNPELQGQQRSSTPPANGLRIFNTLQSTASTAPELSDIYHDNTTEHGLRTGSEVTTKPPSRHTNVHEDALFTEANGQPHPYDDMIIESKNVDTSALGIDPMLWLDYMPPDLLDAFGTTASHTPATPRQPP